MITLKDKITLVTGSSRGVGKGIALGLGEAGAAVYITGRTIEEGTAASKLPGTINQTAVEVNALGGRGIPVQCDHTNDQAVKALFQRIHRDHGRLDLLVNNVWGGYQHYTDGTPFWEEKGFWQAPFTRWDNMFNSGVRAHYTASALAVPLMIAQGRGLIVNISYFAAQVNNMGVIYDTAKAATDQLTRTMAHELRPHNIAVVSLYPGLVRTESVMAIAAHFDLTNSESPRFIGRAVAALAADPHIMDKTGQVLVAALLAQEYNFTDIDGKQPTPLTSESS